MSQQLTLYPPCKPYDSDFMNIDEHEIYYEQCGNPNGKQQSFYTAVPAGVGVRKYDNSLIQKFIGLLFLIKEVVAEVNLMALLKIIRLGI